MKNKKALRIVIIVVAVIAIIGIWLMNGGLTAIMSRFMPPVEATIEQDKAAYGEEEKNVLDTSKRFWTAMEQADEAGMREIADPEATFVHIGMTCKLDQEIGFYTSGTFKPSEIVFHDQSVELFGDTAIVITDCDYTLEIGMSSTSHHFAVTEVYVNRDNQWKLIQFSFTALTN